MKDAKNFDAFLSYSLADRSTATRVSESLTNAGLSVFDPADLAAGKPWADAVHNALVVSDAIVVILPPDGELRANAAIELGAAVALGKPVCIVRPENGRRRIPGYLERYQQYPLSRIDDVVQAVRRGQKPLSAGDLDVLKQIYVEMNLPTDRFVGDPASLDKLAATFRVRAGSTIASVRLLYEMIRQRKQGKWPALKTKRAAKT